MNNEIIIVEQLPIIKQQLQTIKADVTKRVNTAMKLVCTEDNVKEIKAIRAELNKQFAEFEERRKEVKNAILAPYNEFESEYKSCITEPFKTGDSELKAKINNIENELKDQKTKEVKTYFEEYLQSKGIDFVNFENANINVTLSASVKSLKAQAKSFIDRICDDLNLIDTQEHKDEILYEYKQSLNVSSAITSVANRYKAIEAEKAKQAERQAKAEAEQKAVEKVETVVEALTPPTVEMPVEQEQILTLKFTVKGTLTQLKKLKEFLNKGEYDYE